MSITAGTAIPPGQPMTAGTADDASPTGRRSDRRPVRTTATRAVAAVTAAAGLGLVGVGTASSASADVDGIGTFAVADYSCSDGTVYVLPESLTPLDGNWPIWASAKVYDTATGQTLTSGWIQADGITSLTFSVTSPSTVAYVTFAHWSDDGTWHLDNQMVDIRPDLDNGFCDIDTDW
jgi:hypothetical protein